MKEKKIWYSWMTLAVIAFLLYTASLFWIIHWQNEWDVRAFNPLPIEHQSINKTPYPSVSVLDLGIGSASIIRVSAHSAILINTGDPLSAKRCADTLMEMGIDTIDGVVITNTDHNHIGGLGVISQRFPILTIYSPPNAIPIVDTFHSNLYHTLYYM